MANVNITDLTSLTAPATADELEVYDASASENKRITLANLLKSTDTLPLATYTLTVPATGTAALLGAANAFTGANTMQNSGGVGLAIGVAGDSNYRKTLNLLADGPSLRLSTVSGKTNWMMAAQLNVNEGLEFSAGSTDDDGGDELYSAFTPKMTLFSNGHLSIGNATDSGVLSMTMATELLVIEDAGSTSATEQDWIEVTVGATTGYIRVFATK